MSSCINCGIHLSESTSNKIEVSQDLASEKEDWIFNFTLSDKINYKNIKSFYPMIKFITKDNYLIGFSIVVKKRTEIVAKKYAEKLSLRLTRLITLKSGQYTLPILKKYKKVKNKTYPVIKSSTIKFNIEGLLENFKINNNVKNVLTDNDKLNQRIVHAYRGISLYNKDDPVNAIKELFESIENLSIKNYERYELLRDILSHPFPIKKIKEFINCFGNIYFDLINNSFDYDSFKNYENLNKELGEFIKIVQQKLLFMIL